MKSPNLNKTASSFQAWYALPNPTCRLFQWVMLFFFCIYYVGLHVVLHISDSIEHLNFKVWVDFSASIPICFKQSQRTPSPQEQLKTCEDMKCLRRLMDSGWVREWLLPELSLGSSAMLNCRFRRSTKNIIYNIYIYFHSEIWPIDTKKSCHIWSKESPFPRPIILGIQPLVFGGVIYGLVMGMGMAPYQFQC